LEALLDAEAGRVLSGLTQGASGEEQRAQGRLCFWEDPVAQKRVRGERHEARYRY
jgi:hypothetical protein